ncbi:MAG: hypothetical protein U0411_00025 [Thermodesulfovibrionales bacterium]
MFANTPQRDEAAAPERVCGGGKWHGAEERFFFFCSLPAPLFSSCSPPFDGKKFERADRAAREVQRSVDSGAEYRQFGESLLQFSREALVLRDAVRSGKEEELFREYEDLLTIYRDGYSLMKYKAEFVRYGFVPSGTIYVGQEIEPLVAKYGIPTETHLFAPTMQAWKSIPDSSIGVVWSNARSRLAIIETLRKNRG